VAAPPTRQLALGCRRHGLVDPGEVAGDARSGDAGAIVITTDLYAGVRLRSA
jgi:hypothetical protein